VSQFRRQDVVLDLGVDASSVRRVEDLVAAASFRLDSPAVLRRLEGVFRGGHAIRSGVEQEVLTSDGPADPSCRHAGTTFDEVSKPQ
jgi:hypothetical protein